MDKITGKERLSWHRAFVEAVKLELDEYSRYFELNSEYQLNKEPMRIDVIIIKNVQNIEFKKNFARIFRTVNIVEYKSPDDYISVDDFYQVYAYACTYKALNKIDITDISVTFAGSGKSKKLLSHLQETRKYTVEEKWSGVYYIHGDILPIQIIDSRKLSAKENVWLKSLDNRLKTPDMLRVTDEAERYPKDMRISAYLNVIFEANAEIMQEVINMRRSATTLNRVLEESGLTAQWEARGRAEGEARAKTQTTQEIARKLKLRGRPLTEIAEDTGLSPQAIEKL